MSLFRLSVFLIFYKLAQSTGASENVDGIYNTLEDLSYCALQEKEIFSKTLVTLRPLQEQVHNLHRYATYHWNFSHLETHASPVFHYQMFTQFTSNFDTLQHLLEAEKHTEAIASPNFPWPNQGDLNNTLKALAYLYEALEIPVANISNRLSGGRIPVGLTSSQMLDIALLKLQEHHLASAIEWLEESRAQVLWKNDLTLPLTLIEDELEHAIATHNELWRKYPETDLTLFDHEVDMGQEDKILRRSIYRHALKGGVDTIVPNNLALCSGEVLQTAGEQSHLSCYYDRKGLTWLLNPIKVEQHASTVFQFHDVLGKKEMSDLKTRKKRSSDSKTEYDAMKPWSFVEELEIDPPKLLRKLELVTGLILKDPEAAEKFILRESLPGRKNKTQQIPHVDHLVNEQVLAKGGPLIATMLLYLTSVPEGGETSLSNAKVAVPPLKGSITIFFNVWKNGTNNANTYHAACAVIYGNRIVATKWIRYNAQFHTYKCSLNKDE